MHEIKDFCFFALSYGYDCIIIFIFLIMTFCLTPDFASFSDFMLPSLQYEVKMPSASPS